MSTDLINQTLLDRYSVHEFVGRGGMSEVYKVWDYQRAVFLAMKLLREDLAEDLIFLRRFRREAQTLAKLQHPHIVRFYGLEQDGPLAFILMDFVNGHSLRRELFTSVQGFLFHRVLEVMRPVCSALHYAHNTGMIHCDLKPGNILIDKSGQVLVSDFGLSQMRDSAASTMVGMGTPAYMAPEQVRGMDPNPQTDIYACGVILYEMLTGGERPFTGEQARKSGSTGEKVRWEQLHLDPLSPREYNPDILPELETVVLKCLSKMPQDRYQTPLDLVGALEFGLTGLIDESYMESQGGSLSPSTSVEFNGKQGLNNLSPGGARKLKRGATGQVFTLNMGTIFGMIGVLSLIFAIILVLSNQGNTPPPLSEEPVSFGLITVEVVLPTDKEEQGLSETPVPISTNTQAFPTDQIELTEQFTPSITPSPTTDIVDLQICEYINAEGDLVEQEEICIFAVGTAPQFVTIMVPFPPEFEIYLIINRKNFICQLPEDNSEMFFCTGPIQPTTYKLPIQVFRVGDNQVLAEGMLTFFSPTPTATIPAEEIPKCNYEGCEDNLLPTPTP